MRRWQSLFLAVATGAAGALSSGCMLGPTALRTSRTAYNEVVQTTAAEQLLLNLVRLHYREAPLFLDVGNIATQFTFESSGELTNTINQNIPREAPTPDVWEWSAGIGYREQPTVTFTPLQGEDFVKRLLAPIRLDTILLMVRSGWSVDRVLRVTVQRMNGLDNASNASSPTPDRAPEYEKFARVSHAFRELQKQGLLELGYESYPTEIGVPINAEKIGPADLLSAAREGYRFVPTDDGRHSVLTQSESVLVWQPPIDWHDLPAAGEIVTGLGLATHPAPLRYNFREIAGDFRPTEPAGQRTRIEITTRSLLGTLFYLSQGIDIPPTHRRAGRVTHTVTTAGEPFDWTLITGDLLHVHSSAVPPANAVVAVRYRHHWFYIADDDLTSKSTFALLGQLFALQAGSEAGGGPLLTLPLGG